MDYETRYHLGKCSKRTRETIDNSYVYYRNFEIRGYFRDVCFTIKNEKSGEQTKVTFKDEYRGFRKLKSIGNGLQCEMAINDEEEYFQCISQELTMMLSDKNLRINEFRLDENVATGSQVIIAHLSFSFDLRKLKAARYYICRWSRSNLCEVLENFWQNKEQHLNVQKTLHGLGRQLRVQKFNSLFFGDEGYPAILLPFFKPGYLKLIELDHSTGSEQIKLTEIVKLEQWKQAETIVVKRGIRVSKEDYRNVPRFSCYFVPLSKSTFINLLDHYGESETFQQAVLGVDLPDVFGGGLEIPYEFDYLRDSYTFQTTGTKLYMRIHWISYYIEIQKTENFDSDWFL